MVQHGTFGGRVIDAKMSLFVRLLAHALCLLDLANLEVPMPLSLLLNVCRANGTGAIETPLALMALLCLWYVPTALLSKPHY